jgi:prefoldin subunit 5
MSTTDEDVEMLRDIRAGFSSTGWHTATTDPNSWPAALDRAIQALEQERETVNGAIEAVHDATAEVVMLKRRAEAAEESVRLMEIACDHERRERDEAIRGVHELTAEVEELTGRNAKLTTQRTAAEERVRTLEAALRRIDQGLADAGADPFVAGETTARDVIAEVGCSTGGLPSPTDSGPYHQEHHDADDGREDET